MNKKIIILTLVTAIIVMLELIFVFFRNTPEGFTNYYRCEKRPLGGIYKEILNEEDVSLTHDLSEFGLYYPCGYNGVERELRNLDLGDRKGQNVFGICGSDTIASKSSLWKVVSGYYGREFASKLIPESWLLKNNVEFPLFEEKFDGDKTYILKKNVQRKKGIKLTSDLEEVKNANKDKYVMVQEKRDSIIINKRRLNLRIYVFVVYKQGKKSVFIHDSAKVLYTSKDVDENTGSNSEEFETLITNSYVTDLEIYNKNPLTMNKLLDYLEENRGVNSVKMRQKIYNLLKNVMIALLPKVCNCKNMRDQNMYQMFGADVLIDTDYNPYVLEFNKGPDMKHKDEADHKLKKKVIFDTFEKMGVIKGKDKAYKNGYAQII
jgi:hypothetical protein